MPLLEAGKLLLVSDFDGTLARLVPDPWGARIIPGAQRALRRLAGAPQVWVALLSGRTVADLAARARVGGISYLGDHGTEIAEAARGFRTGSLAVRHDPVPADAAAVLARLSKEVPRDVPDAWLVVEAKRAGVTFHFRGAPDIEAARARVVAASDAVDRDGLLVRWVGRRSLELRHAGAHDKGSALAALIAGRGPRSVIALGDDHSDTLAFEALRRARARGTVEGLAIAVAGHPDVSAAVAPSADLLLSSPDAAASFLRRLGVAALRR